MNTSVANVFVAPSAGDANTGLFHAYVKSGDGSAHNWKFGAYATSGGSPAAQLLLSSVPIVSSTTSASFSDQSGSVTWTGIVSGTSYALARNGESAQAKIAYDAGLGIFYYNPGLGWQMDAAFGASPSTQADVKTSLWVDFTSSGGGRTTRNTRSAPLGTGVGMGLGMAPDAPPIPMQAKREGRIWAVSYDFGKAAA